MANSTQNNIVERKKLEKGDERDAQAALSLTKGNSKANGLVFLETHKRMRMMKRNAPGGKAPGKGKPMGSPRSNEMGEQIGRELRGLYDDVVAQPVPDRFLDLLNRLETGAISSRADVKSPGER